MDESLIISNPGRVFAFVKQYAPVYAVADMQGIGHEKSGELIAGVLYEGYNSHNVWMHIGAKPGSLWATRRFIYTVLHYPFVTMGCRRVTAHIEASNRAARKFVERVGFKCEAVLKNAASDGGDVTLYVMWRESFNDSM
jgi:RimJ/RimL family protein N-acetyltransferase